MTVLDPDKPVNKTRRQPNCTYENKKKRTGEEANSGAYDHRVSVTLLGEQRAPRVDRRLGLVRVERALDAQVTVLVQFPFLFLLLVDCFEHPSLFAHTDDDPGPRDGFLPSHL